MEFTKYNSIENAYRQKFIDHCQELGIADWVALEKVHGANFSFICTGDMEVIPAKRSGTIGVNAHGNYEFYGCNPVVEEYAEKVKELANVIGGPIQVFGELYGEGVQKEVNYGSKGFVAFDILLANGEYLDWPRVRDLCMIFGIPTAPELLRGTLERLLDMSPEFTSGLSPTGDSAEGVVIKPLRTDARLPNGSRAVIKNKSKAFSEKKQKVAKKPSKMPEHLQPVFEEFCTYLSKNRLNNVISKMGDITQKDFGKLTGLLTQDAKEEFEGDGYFISKDDWKAMAKQVGKEASGVVREQWLNILDDREAA